MILELTEEQKAVRDAARDFAQNVLKPGVIDRTMHSNFRRKKSANSGSSGSWA